MCGRGGLEVRASLERNCMCFWVATVVNIFEKPWPKLKLVQPEKKARGTNSARHHRHSSSVAPASLTPSFSRDVAPCVSFALRWKRTLAGVLRESGLAQVLFRRRLRPNRLWPRFLNLVQTATTARALDECGDVRVCPFL